MADPRARLARIRAGLTPREWARVGGMAVTVIGLNVLGWGMLPAAVGGHYHISGTELFGFGTGMLAYTLGMRHAFDADHIAAIDNTTRKLVNDGQAAAERRFLLLPRPLVDRLRAGRPAELRHPRPRRPGGQRQLGPAQVTSIVGTVGLGHVPLPDRRAQRHRSWSAIVKVFREMRQGEYDDDELERQLDNRGLMNRFFGGYAQRIDTPWKMYPVGVLFGLGFDTATEVALLVLAGTAVASGLPFYAILSLPILFAAGMSLFDTIDGCFMNFAYDWAFAQPDPQGVLQPDHHRPLGLRRLLHRHHRDPRADRAGGRPQRRLLDIHGELQHQHGRLRHRRHVRGDLGGGLVGLALRPDRAAVGSGRGGGCRPGPGLSAESACRSAMSILS